MSETVFVIEQGSYSDYRVVGIFSTKEAAEIVLKAIDDEADYERPTIAEWPLNPRVEEINAGLRPYTVLMLRDGSVEQVKADETISSYEIRGILTSDRIHRRSRLKIGTFGYGKPDVLIATVWAADDKHAVKIVNERRGQMIAMGQWEDEA